MIVGTIVPDLVWLCRMGASLTPLVRLGAGFDKHVLLLTGGMATSGTISSLLTRICVRFQLVLLLI